MSELLFEAVALKKHFPIRSPLLKRITGHIKAVNDVSFTLNAGETIGIVGESGCGKTTLGRVVVRAYAASGGSMRLNGQDVTGITGSKLKEYRKSVQMIFQDPYSSLNPKMRVREMIAEPLWVNGLKSRAEAMEMVPKLLETVGMRATDAQKFPHQFSGGQRQRIGIARAIAMKPSLIVADEAVSALDVSIQAQILNLLMELKKELKLSYMFISHNLAVVKHISDKVGVMYLGGMVEFTEKDVLYSNPLHPYTKALLSAAPVADRSYKMNRIIMRGDVPNPAAPPPGCAFSDRCQSCMDVCRKSAPAYKDTGGGHMVACNLY